MTRARDFADVISGQFDLPAGALDNAVADGSITAAKLASSAVTTAKIAADAVTNAKIAADAITSTEIADDAIAAAAIADDAVVAATIADNAVGSAAIADDAITSAKIKDNLLSGTNLLINGGMQVSQRGQTFTSISSNQYTCDRWFYQISGSGGRGTATQETSGGPAGFKDNFLRVTVTNTDSTVAADDIILVKQVLEGHVAAFTDQGTADAQDLTLSFYVRSSITGTFSATLLTNFSPTPASHPKNYTINSANTWERKVITFPGYTTSKTLVSSGYTNGEYMLVRFALVAGSNRTGTADQWNLANDFATTSQTNFFANSSATWDITGCQLQVGSITNPEFEHRSFGDELRRCQRYFEDSGDGNQYTFSGSASGFGGNTYFDSADFKVTKRAVPTITITDTSGNSGRMTVFQGATGYDNQQVFFETTRVNAFAPRTGGGRTDAGLGRAIWSAEAEL